MLFVKILYLKYRGTLGQGCCELFPGKVVDGVDVNLHRQRDLSLRDNTGREFHNLTECIYG